MATSAVIASVIYMPYTGHVLAAVTGAGLEPTIDELIAGTHLRVRYPASLEYVDVPRSVLEVKRLSVTADVLDAPQAYAIVPGPVELSRGDPPIFGGATATALPATIPAGTAAVAVWHDGDTCSAETGGLGTGNAPPGNPPPGATHQLLAVKGQPLHLTSTLA